MLPISLVNGHLLLTQAYGKQLVLKDYTNQALACVSAFAPTVIDCGEAAIAGGANTTEDLTCLKDALTAIGATGVRFHFHISLEFVAWMFLLSLTLSASEWK